MTDATRQGIATTLRGLPGDEPAGKLTRPLEPRGFGMLEGVSAGGRVKTAPSPAPARKQPRSEASTARGQSKEDRQAAQERAHPGEQDWWGVFQADLYRPERRTPKQDQEHERQDRETTLG